jgi:RNA polymerase sigma factor (sigma-70 family)
MNVVKKYSDTELVAALKPGSGTDEHAIKFMYLEYYTLLKTYVCQNNGNEADAEDIFQEVVVAFINMIHQNKFRAESSIKTFLFALNRNMWLNELKKRGRAEKRNTVFEQAKEIDEAGIAVTIAQHESQKQILAVVASLGETCKKILLAFYYDNLSMKEILTTLHYESEQVVRNKKYKCLKQLEQLLTANPQLAQKLKNAFGNE